MKRAGRYRPFRYDLFRRELPGENSPLRRKHRVCKLSFTFCLVCNGVAARFSLTIKKCCARSWKTHLLLRIVNDGTPPVTCLTLRSCECWPLRTAQAQDHFVPTEKMRCGRVIVTPFPPLCFDASPRLEPPGPNSALAQGRSHLSYNEQMREDELAQQLKLCKLEDERSIAPSPSRQRKRSRGKTCSSTDALDESIDVLFQPSFAPLYLSQEVGFIAL